MDLNSQIKTLADKINKMKAVADKVNNKPDSKNNIKTASCKGCSRHK